MIGHTHFQNGPTTILLGVIDSICVVTMTLLGVLVIQERFVAAGGELRDEHAVTEIVPGQVITVRTDKGSFRTKKLVVTVGAWSPRLLRTLGVELPFEVGMS